MARVSYQLDNHVANAVAEELRSKGIEAWTANESGFLRLDDPDILRRCLELNRVVVTNDSDFIDLSNLGAEHAGIVYWPQQTKSIGQIIEGLVLVYEVYEDADQMRGRIEYL